MKKYIVIAAVVLVLSGWIYLDFQWNDTQIKHYSNTEWVPAAVQDNAVIHPWNFVKCSVSGIWFIREPSMLRISDNIVIAEVMHIDRQGGASAGFDLFDCTHKKVAFLSDEEVANRDFSAVKWHEFDPKMPGGQLLAFVSNRLDSIPRQEETDKKTQQPDRTRLR